MLFIVVVLSFWSKEYTVLRSKIKCVSELHGFVDQWGTQKSFMRGVSFNGVWCHLYLVCVVCDVIFMLSKPTFWRNLR